MERWEPFVHSIGLTVGGAAVLLTGHVRDYGVTLAGDHARSFGWTLLCAGISLAVVAVCTRRPNSCRWKPGDRRGWVFRRHTHGSENSTPNVSSQFPTTSPVSVRVTVSASVLPRTVPLKRAGWRSPADGPARPEM